MPYVHQDNHFIAFVIPDNADVHVDAALKKVRGSLDTFGAQRRVGRIFGQKFQLVFKLLLLLCGQALKMLLETGRKGTPSLNVRQFRSVSQTPTIPGA